MWRAMSKALWRPRNCVALATAVCVFEHGWCELRAPEVGSQKDARTSKAHTTAAQSVRDVAMTKLVHRLAAPLPLLPCGLEHLEVSGPFNGRDDPLPPHMPPGLKSLTVGSCFNAPLPSPLPSTLEVLDVGQSFNCVLPELPTSLRELKLGNAFNQPLPDLLPPNLKVLHTGDRFNYPLPCTLPPGLQELRLGAAFNQPLPLTLPVSLTSLRLGTMFGKALPAAWPNQLVRLELGRAPMGPLPPLPDQLQSLVLVDWIHVPVPPLPAGLQHLRLEHLGSQLPDELPPGLTCLELIGSYCEPLPSKLPAALKKVVLAEYFWPPVTCQQMQHVESLTLIDPQWPWLELPPSIRSLFVMVQHEKQKHAIGFDIPPTVREVWVNNVQLHMAGASHQGASVLVDSSNVFQNNPLSPIAIL